MPFERHPSIPPPPPPPGPKKTEGAASPELSSVEQALFKNSAEYANLTPEEAQMTPKMREILEGLRKDRLFAIKVYVLSGGNDGHTDTTYDNNTIKSYPGPIYNEINPEGGLEEDHIRYKREHNVAEAISFQPRQIRERRTVEKVVRPKGLFRKEITESVTEYGSPRPIQFGQILPTCPPAVAKEPLVHITYHASDPRDRMRYAIDTWVDVSWRSTHDELVQTPVVMRKPKPASADPAQNIERHMKDILRVRTIKPGHPRGNNFVAINVRLPKSRAEELWNYFQQHPEHVRPFFVAGAEDIMPLHLPPPYAAWDRELPQKPILFRQFDGSKKEVSPPVIKNSKQSST